VLGRNRELFVAYRVTPIELIAFVLLVSFVFPALLAAAVWAAFRVHRAAGQTLYLVFGGLLFAIVISEVLVKTSSLDALPHVAVALAGGTAAAWACYAVLPFRTFLSVLSPSAVVFAGIFLLQPAMRPFIRDRKSVV